MAGFSLTIHSMGPNNKTGLLLFKYLNTYMSLTAFTGKWSFWAFLPTQSLNDRVYDKDHSTKKNASSPDHTPN